MANNSSLIINSDLVNSFPINKKFKLDLDRIARKDSKGKSFFKKEIPAIALDSYEHSLHKSQPEEAVDAVVGVSDFLNGKITNDRMMLVELKLNCKTPYNVSVSNCNRKKSHSEILIKDLKPGTQIDRKYCLVFKSQIYNQVISWFQNKQRQHGYMKEWECINPEDFETLFNA